MYKLKYFLIPHPYTLFLKNLHVLNKILAFILSQDQTQIHNKN